jgi:hypothetical protein
MSHCSGVATDATAAAVVVKVVKVGYHSGSN